MTQKHVILKGALILTIAGFANRIIGFFYRIFLSQAIGAEGMGIYQLIFPVYAMTFSLTVSGIQTAISKFVAAKLGTGDQKGARNTLIAGTMLSFSASLLAAFFLHWQADRIAENLLMESRCTELLTLLAWSIPFRSIHACITGYYYGTKKSHIPAMTQLLEQLVRVGSSYLAYIIFLERGLTITPIVIVIGMVCEEIASALFSITSLLVKFTGAKKIIARFSDVSTAGNRILSQARNILTLSLPLTFSRVLLNTLQIVESVCIPLRLRLFGLNTASSLSVYGILNGMAIPLILFPSAITNSISVLLLPTVSEAQAQGNHRQITSTIENTLRYSLLLGILCTGIFLVFGNDLGRLLFKEDTAGSFILTLAWICPFLYMGTTMSSIINGLGKTIISFWQNTIALLIRILFVWFAIPTFGIVGYLWGLLVSELFFSFSSLFVLSKDYHFTFDSLHWLVKPVCVLFVSTGVMLFLKQALLHFSLPSLLLLFILGVTMTISYLILLWPDLQFSLKRQ